MFMSTRDLVFVASAASIEVSVIARQEDKVQKIRNFRDSISEIKQNIDQQSFFL